MHSGNKTSIRSMFSSRFKMEKKKKDFLPTSELSERKLFPAVVLCSPCQIHWGWEGPLHMPLVAAPDSVSSHGSWCPNRYSAVCASFFSAYDRNED